MLFRSSIGIANVRFHREFQNKTCPGTRVGLIQFRNMVADCLGAEPAVPVPDTIPAVPYLRVVVGSDTIDECQPKIVNAHLWVLAAEACTHFKQPVPPGIDVHASGYALGTEVFGALGYTVEYVATAQGKRWYLKRPEWLD